MQLLITILATVLIIYGLVLFLAPGKGSFIAAVICIGCGVYAYDSQTFLPLVGGVIALFVLRALGMEKR